MILHCGPTGSGKSMTLYSALNEINTPDVNIQTAEDPIEYTLAGINQMQMNRQIGLTFAARAALLPAAGSRHHPRRRNPRPGDRRDRRRGRAHRPLAALDAAHQRRAVDDRPPRRDGHRAVHDDLVAPAACARSACCAASARTARSPTSPTGERRMVGVDPATTGRARSTGRAAAAPHCNGIGYRAASAPTSSWSRTTPCGR